MSKFFQLFFVQCLFIGLVHAAPIIKYNVEITSIVKGDDQKKDVATAVLNGNSLILQKGERVIYKTELLTNKLDETECKYLNVDGKFKCVQRHKATVKRRQILAMARTLVNVKNDGAHELLDLCQCYDGCRTAEDYADGVSPWFEGSHEQNDIPFKISNDWSSGKVRLLVLDTRTKEKYMIIEFKFKGIEGL